VIPFFFGNDGKAETNWEDVLRVEEAEEIPLGVYARGRIRRENSVVKLEMEVAVVPYNSTLTEGRGILILPS
jgi:hypothetical protein